MAFVPRKGKSPKGLRVAVGKTAREVLNELRWREPSRIRDAVIVYRDRTRPEGFRTIRGSEVVDLERRYFTVAGARLPYYRIERIEEAGRTVFERATTDRPRSLSPISDR